MEIGTGIAIAGVWIYAGLVRGMGSNLTELAITNSVQRAWMVTVIAVVVQGMSNLIK